MILEKKKYKLWFEESEIRTKIKKIKDQERNAIIAYYVEQLMKLQTEEGEISKLALSGYLNDLANEIRNLYES